jgi:hypothetical protein
MPTVVPLVFHLPAALPGSGAVQVTTLPAVLHDQFNSADGIKTRRTTLLGFVGKHVSDHYP